MVPTLVLLIQCILPSVLICTSCFVGCLPPGCLPVLLRERETLPHDTDSSLFTAPHSPFKVQLENPATFVISVVMYVLKIGFPMMPPHSLVFSQQMGAGWGFLFSEHFSPTSLSESCLPLWRSKKQVHAHDLRLLKPLVVLQQTSRPWTRSGAPIFAPAFCSLQQDTEAWCLRYSACHVSQSRRGTSSRGVCAWGSQMVFSRTTLSGDSSRSELMDRHQIPSELPNPKWGSSAQLPLQHWRLICVHIRVHP